MSDKTHIDASAIDTFFRCREEFRIRYVEKIDTIKPNVHLEFGSAVHEGVSKFWEGRDYDDAFVAANARTLAVDQSYFNPKELEQWSRMCDYLPDLMAEYFRFWGESQSYQLLELGGAPVNEHLWSHEAHNVVLCGRMDHVFKAPVLALSEVKTATEMGSQWRDEYQLTMTRNTGLALYDWFLRQQGITVDRIQVEVLLKPGRSKGAQPRMEIIELPEIMASRSRFDQQLAWKCAEIDHYVRQYSGVRPWPMADGNACKGMYNSPCPMLKRCVYGDTPKVMKGFGPKKAHTIEEVMSRG